jgi:hypothetical protein
MPLKLLPMPRLQAFALGIFSPGAKAHFYETGGGTTPQNTYSDPDGDISHLNANPVIADSSGLFGPIYILAEDYRLLLTTTANVTIYSQDDISGS